MINLIIKLIDYSNKIKVLRFFKKNLNKNQLNIIDIGGHKGETLNFFIKNFYINKIFVFEPNIHLYNYIKKKFFNKKIFLFNYGVGYSNEKKELKITIDSASSTINKINTNTEYFRRKKKFLTWRKKNPFFLEPQNIEIVNLSDFLLSKEKKIDVLKIDTEGYEFNILRGITQNDFKKIKFIYFEHHFDLMIEKKYKFKDVDQLLKKNNFSQKLKIRMKFRKSFEYIYESKNQ